MSMPTDLDGEDKKQAVVEYLQAPRKKRKNFVLLAVNQQFDREISSGIEAFVKKTHPQLATAMPRNERELKRFFSRQVVLLIIEDTFTKLDNTLELVLQLKTKKKEMAVPVVFLTDHAEALINSYHQKLIAYQEVDNYITYRSMPSNQIHARIQSSLMTEAARRSRRFKIDIPIAVFRLSENGYFNGRLLDISLHGGVLIADAGRVFKINDQFLLHVPCANILPAEHGEFIRLSARVRRVFMAGNKVGISWEYLSESQHQTLMQFVTELINQEMYIKARKGGG